MIPAWTRGYIGIPFKARGRDRTGCDCWGLVRLVLCEQYGHNLPSFDDEYAALDVKGDEALIKTHLPDLLRLVRSPSCGDIALMRIRGALSHVGLYLGDGFILHTDHGIDSSLGRVAQLLPRIEGYYRVR